MDNGLENGFAVILVTDNRACMQGNFRIGEHLIHSRLNAIRHRGTTLHLEPKVMQFSGPRLSRCENRVLPLGEVPKNGSFSSHFSLIGS